MNRNTAGFAIGGGIALKVAHFRLSPEIRYTRWTSHFVLRIGRQSGRRDRRLHLLI